MDVVDSPGRQTDARAELERRVERAADRAAARFLAGVLTDALAAVEGTVMVAAAVEPFTLGQVMTRWAPASERIAAAVVTAAGSPDMPGQVDRTYLAKVQARIAASNLPLDVHRDVRDTLTGPLASRLDGRPDRGQMKAALRKSLRAPRERSVYRAQVNRIARTETTSLFGYATQAKLTAEGVPGKKWVPRYDARTRPTHAAAGGQTVAVGEPFLVGGYAMMHPGDPAGPAKETASCRCVMTAVKRFGSPLAPPPVVTPAIPQPPANPSSYDDLVRASGGDPGRWGSTLLTDDEQRAILNYRGVDFADINQWLRIGRTKAKTRVTGQVEQLRSAIGKNRMPETVRVYRGIQEQSKVFPEGNMAGGTFTDKTFLSTSHDRDMAKGFINRRDSAVMEIIIPEGKYALPLNSTESEILLPPGATLRIVSDEMVEDYFEYKTLRVLKAVME